MILSWRLSTNLCCVYFSPAPPVKRFCRRLSSHVSASILVRLQVKREGGEYVLASFIKFMVCMILPGCVGGTVLPVAL